MWLVASAGAHLMCFVVEVPGIDRHPAGTGARQRRKILRDRDYLLATVGL